jgi:transposase
VSLSRFDRSQIKETARQLRQLERQYADSSGSERIAALLLLKTDPSLTLIEAAARLGRSRRAVQRWLEAYRRGGIGEMLSPAVRRGRPRRLDADAVHALRQELKNARLGRITDVQEYLQRQFGLDLSASGVWYMMRRDLSAVPRGWMTVHDESDREHFDRSGDGRGISRRVIDFLNALPTTDDTRQWIIDFREALATFLGDVDRISINVDLTFDREEATSGQIVTQHVQSSTTARSRMAITVARDHAETPSQRLLSEVRAGGFPVSSFHPPSTFDYYVGAGVYIGSVILWRNCTESPISDATLAVMRELERFILFALSDIIARNKAARPVDTAFSDALRRMNADADLSAQEQRIVILQLMGHSYKEMADLLSVTVDTVKKHFTQIHRKTGTRSQSELFAKYFTFRLGE